MEGEYVHETFRSDMGDFDKNFADYMIERHKGHMSVKKCTFFQDKDKMKKWASCLFQQEG